MSAKTRRGDYTELIGKEFGRWTVIERADRDLSNRVRLLCKCSCGTVKVVRKEHLDLGKSKSCGCIRNDRIEEAYCKIPQAFWNHLSVNAPKRGDKNLEFSITRDYVWEIYEQQNKKCALSGIPISFSYHPYTNTKFFGTTASLDRIDSSKGYVPGNVQWVHKDVNKIKQNLDQDYFLSLCLAIYEFKLLPRENRLDRFINELRELTDSYAI